MKAYPLLFALPAIAFATDLKPLPPVAPLKLDVPSIFLANDRQREPAEQPQLRLITSVPSPAIRATEMASMPIVAPKPTVPMPVLVPDPSIDFKLRVLPEK